MTDAQPDAGPLIVTLRLDDESSRLFDRERRRYFPPERNFLRAHVTLFHKLPRENEDFVRAVLEETASRTLTFPVGVTGLRSLGRGVAYELFSEELARLRTKLTARFTDLLTAQDRQGFRPHVTVQNKVTPQAARALLVQLEAGFSPWEAEGRGLDLWAYRGGPWEALGFFSFMNPGAEPA